MNYNNVYDITIQQMETCVLAAATGSFTGVANSLYITQSAVSKQIKNVEDRIGFLIFTRGKGANLTVTNEGKIILEKWNTLIKQYNEALIEAAEAGSKTKNSITIATPSSSNTSAFLIPAIRQFEEEHPEYEIHIVYQTPTEAKQSLMKGSVNMVFCNSYRKDLFMTDEYDCVQLISSNWHVGMMKNNPLAERTSVNWRNLRTQKFVIVNDYIFIKMLGRYCDEAGFEPKVSYANISFNGLADNVHDDKTVFIVDPYMNDFGKTDFKYFELENAPIDYFISYKKSDEINPVVLKFAKFVKNYSRAHNLTL